MLFPPTQMVYLRGEGQKKLFKQSYLKICLLLTDWVWIIQIRASRCWMRCVKCCVGRGTRMQQKLRIVAGLVDLLGFIHLETSA